MLDVFGFTSREKVAALTQTLLARDNPAALSLIQKEAESGRELSQLLGELIGCLRALLVAKLDPSADGEGIPKPLWEALLKAADEYAPDRILAAIDVFAETEGRMKWATNKRLHFELGVIKAIQSLGEVRITDVIKVLTRGADFIPTALATAAPAPAKIEPTPQPEPTREPEPEPLPAAEVPAPEPTPAPEPVAAKPRPTGGLSGFDSLIDAAPEVSELPPPPEPPPWKTEKPAAEVKPPEPAPVVPPPTTPSTTTRSSSPPSSNSKEKCSPELERGIHSARSIREAGERIPLTFASRDRLYASASHSSLELRGYCILPTKIPGETLNILRDTLLKIIAPVNVASSIIQPSGKPPSP